MKENFYSWYQCRELIIKEGKIKQYTPPIIKFNIPIKYKLVKSFGVRYNAKRNRFLRDSVNYHTSFLPEKTTYQQRIFHILENTLNIPICPVCGGKNKFLKIRCGYTRFCSTSCANKGSSEKRLKTNESRYGHKFGNIKKRNENWLKKYGVEYPTQSKEIQEKKENSILKKYKVTNISKSEEIKQKKKKNYNNKSQEEKKEIYIKAERTKIKNNPNYHKDQKKKANETYKKRTGYDHQAYNPTCNFGKGLQTIKKYHKIAKHIHYQSLNEKAFIDLWLEYYPINSIQNGPTLKYYIEDNYHLYYPDFEITYPDNTKDIIEIKAPHQYFYKDLASGKLFQKWNSVEMFIKEHKDYKNYYFILNNSIFTKQEIIDKYLIPYFHKNYPYL